MVIAAVGEGLSRGRARAPVSALVGHEPLARIQLITLSLEKVSRDLRRYVSPHPPPHNAPAGPAKRRWHLPLPRQSAPVRCRTLPLVRLPCQTAQSRKAGKRSRQKNRERRLTKRWSLTERTTPHRVWLG